MWKSQFESGGPWTKPWHKRGFGVDPDEEPEAEEQARVPGPHADQGGPKDPQPATPARQAASGGERRLEIGSVGRAHPGAGAPGGFGLPPSSRITRPREIRTLLGRGRRKKTSCLDVFFLSSEEPGPRVGFVVPKHRRTVVDRNRVKRRLRELARRELLPRLSEEGLCLDVLIRARREAYQASYRQLRRELLEVTEELCSGHSFWR